MKLTGYPDHVYGFIEVKKEIQALIESSPITPQFERLKELSHLGPIADIFPLSKHTKFEHALGLYHLVCLTSDFLPSKKIQKDSFKLAGLLHGIGHLPYSYTAEKALLVLSSINQKFKIELQDHIKPVRQRLCENCLRETCFKNVLENLDEGELFKWFTATKILNLEQYIRGKRMGNVDQILKYVVCKKDKVNQLLYQLDKLEYTMRDSFYYGRFSIRLALRPFLAGISFDEEGSLAMPPLWGCVESAAMYLDENFYSHPSVVAYSQILSKALSKKIQDKHQELSEVTKWTDRKLRSFLAKEVEDNTKKIARGTIESVLKDYSIRPSAQSTLSIEKRIAATDARGILNYPARHGYTVSAQKWYFPGPEKYAIQPPASIYIAYDNSYKNPRRVLECLFRAQRIKRHTEGQLRLQAASFILGCDAKESWDRYSELLRPFLVKKLPRRQFKEDAIRSVLSKADESLIRWILFDYEFHGYDRALDRVHRHFLSEPDSVSKDVMDEWKSSLERKKGARRQKAEEILVYLHFLERANKKYKVAWAIPGIRFFGFHKEGDENELDTIGIGIERTRMVGVEMHEVTVTKDPTGSHRGKLEDKLKGFMHRIKTRFTKGIRVRIFINRQEIK